MKTIEIENLEMSFPQKGGKRFYALQDFSLDVYAGQVFCLLGPNGLGKTTTINLINGLNRPTQGNVRVMGLNPVKDMRKVRQIIAVAPQETALYNDLTF